MMSFPYKKIHGIGIGGIGMSALAKYARYQGMHISGSDIEASDIIADLRDNYQADIHIPHHPENITDDIDAVIYSPAIPETNPEYLEARDRGLPLFSYPEFLGMIAKEQFTIAVSGTNGKTTTSAMIIESLKHLGKDPSAILGGILAKYQSNFVAGSDDLFVVEACEYKSSFLNIFHNILVITNITEDHLDYFKDLKDIQNTFINMVHNSNEGGVIICNTEDEALFPVIQAAEEKGMQLINYAPYLKDLTLSIPGEYNRKNAAAALAVIDALKLNLKEAHNYLAHNFVGAERRLESYGMTQAGCLLFDDYAHNPEALELLIQGLRETYPERKLIMAFEPHLYSRTEDFFDAFVEVLGKVDELYLLPIYKAREAYQPEKDFALKEALQEKHPHLPLHTVPSYEAMLPLFEQKHYNQNDLFITVGAGPIFKIVRMIKNKAA